MAGSNPVGAAVGAAVGVGFGVGAAVGVGVGLGLGEGVGVGLGLGEGVGLGNGVGVGVGASLARPPWDGLGASWPVVGPPDGEADGSVPAPPAMIPMLAITMIAMTGAISQGRSVRRTRIGRIRSILEDRAGSAFDRCYSRDRPIREQESRMDVHDLADLLDARAASGGPWLEFIRSPDLSVGLYVLPAGGTDLQSPHTEDEVYWIVSGSGTITVGEEQRQIRAGSVVFVAATVPHRFHDIEEELVILVAFGPPEGSRVTR